MTGGGETLPRGALPASPLEVTGGDEAGRLSNLLATCRDYGPNTGESVQLVSWLVAMHTWLLMEHRPAPVMSLAALRPGAGVLGNEIAAEAQPPEFTAALRAVDDAGAAAFNTAIAEGKSVEIAATAKTEARAAAALVHAPRLVARTRRVAAGQAAIMGTHEKADDAAIMLQLLAVILQFKAKTTGPAAGVPGGDATMGPQQIATFIAAMAKKPRHTAAEQYAFELVTLSRAPSAASALTGRKSGGHFENGAQLDEVDLGNNFALVITRETVPSALGDVFGGVAARCDVKEGSEDGKLFR